MAGYLSKKGVYISATDAVSLSGYLKADGTVPLTADWNVGAFDLTCVDMNATNFKLSGVGTLTSALGNVSLTTSLTAASGDEIGFYLPVTVNKAAGNYTAFKVNVTETSAPGTSDYLMDLQVGETSIFRVLNSGVLYLGTNVSSNFRTNILIVDVVSGDVFSFRSNANVEIVDTDGSQAWFYIAPKINQSGTAGYQALKIDVTETALGDGTTGANRLITAQVGSVEKAAIDNKGAITSTMINNADSDTDEIDSVTWAGGYGMVIAASTTDGTSAIWKLEGTTFTAISVDVDWTAVKDNASTYNVYIETGAIKLQNKVGDDKAVKLGFFGI
jgi:hypothetical protein